MSHRGIVGVLIAGLALTSVAAGPGTAGAAPSIASARAQAKAIARDVAALEIQAEAATEDYNAVQEKLAQVVTQYLSASQNLSQLGQQHDDQTNEAAARVRALYRAGGPLGLYATVLGGADLTDALSRYSNVTRVLEEDQRAIKADSQRVATASTAASALDALATQRTELEAASASAKVKIEGLLANRHAELTAANGTLAQLVVAEQVRVAAEQAAKARTTLGTDAAAPDGVPAGTPAQISVALAYARSKLGATYVWGATGPDTFDCSGLTQWAYRLAGVSLPRTSRQQWFAGTHPAIPDLQVGDLLFWATNSTDPATIHHVAFYIGGGYMLEAPHTGSFVRIVPVYLDGYFGATRPVQPTAVPGT